MPRAFFGSRLPEEVSRRQAGGKFRPEGVREPSDAVRVGVDLRDRELDRQGRAGDADSVFRAFSQEVAITHMSTG